MNWSLPFAWPPPAPKDLPFELAVRMGVAAGIALYIARAVGLHYPEYTLLAVATCADVHPDGSWLLSGYRLVGTIIGVSGAAVVLDVWGVTPLSAGIGFAIIALFCTAVGARHSLRLALLVFSIGTTTTFAHHHTTWAWGRLLSTSIGCAVAIAVSLVPWPTSPWYYRKHELEAPAGYIVGQE